MWFTPTSGIPRDMASPLAPARPTSRQPMRPGPWVTAIAESLTDPAGAYYVLDMEGRLYEVDIRTLEPKLLFEKPVPGWHAKGMYRYQQRLVVTNNGEHPARKFDEPPYLVGSDPVDPEDAGVLAEWDGENWTIVKRRQFTEVTMVGDVRGRGQATATA